MTDTATRELERRWTNGDEEALTALKATDRRTTTIPMEVWARIERSYYSDLVLYTTVPLSVLLDPKTPQRVINSKLTRRVQPWRIRYYAKETTDKCAAWVEVVNEKPCIVKKVERYTGWRKAHTEHYWVYFALDLALHRVTCPHCKGSGGDVVDCSVCDGAGRVVVTPCPTCGGDSSEFTGCEACHGYGVTG